LGQHLRAHDALEDVVLLAMQDAISHWAVNGYAGTYLTDEKRSHVRHNLATTIPIAPIHGDDKGCFGDLLLVLSSNFSATGDLTACQRPGQPHYNNNPNFDHLNSQLTKFLRHIDRTKSYYCFVDVQFSFK
jgi:hypothetical protein